MHKKPFNTLLLTASLMLIAGTAQAAPFQLAQAGMAGNTPAVTTQTTVTTPAQAPEAPAQQAAPPAATTTQVEVHNEAPAAQAPAPAQDIKIEMPDAPDVNIVAPAQGTDKETTIERSTTIIDSNKPEPRQSDNTLIYLMIFGILTALALFAVMYGRRRTVIVDTLP